VFWILIRVALAVLVALAIYVIGASAIKKFTIAAPEEPDPEDLAPVDLEFQCQVCGARVTMTSAQREGELEAPRHCREDMVLVG